jgi:NAD-dependent SIR2 family protein deacetylase
LFITTDEALKHEKELRCPECQHNLGRHPRAAKMGALSHAVLHFGEISSITEQIKDAADIDRIQAELLVIVGTVLTTEGMQNTVLKLLLSSNPPKCLFIDVCKRSLPVALSVLSTLPPLDWQLLAERICSAVL